MKKIKKASKEANSLPDDERRKRAADIALELLDKLRL